MYLVSACLAGINCRYDGSNNYTPLVKKLVDNGKAIPICPEVIAGLKIPRLCCEVKNIDGERRVINENGIDLTKKFKQAAEKCLEIIKILEIDKVILKAKSPSCGYKYIYDGSFSNKLIQGNGITTQLLIENGIQIFTEYDLEKKNIKLE